MIIFIAALFALGIFESWVFYQSRYPEDLFILCGAFAVAFTLIAIWNGVAA